MRIKNTKTAKPHLYYVLPYFDELMKDSFPNGHAFEKVKASMVGSPQKTSLVRGKMRESTMVVWTCSVKIDWE